MLYANENPKIIPLSACALLIRRGRDVCSASTLDLGLKMKITSAEPDPCIVFLERTGKNPRAGMPRLATNGATTICPYILANFVVSGCHGFGPIERSVSRVITQE